jgi:hypothetical protein
MKNDLTTWAWQHDIGCPISITLLSTSDEFEDPESQELFLQCLTPIWHREIPVLAQQFEEYSNEAHLSAVKAAIQYLETLLQNQDDFPPDFEPSDEEDVY